MACKVTVNRHGFLAFRLYWNGHKAWEGTRLKDTPKNRERVQARAVLISEQMEVGKFDYLRWFPKGNCVDQFRPKEKSAALNKTIGEYFVEWIETKKPPFVRPGLQHDYTRQFRRYILPKLSQTRIVDLTLQDLEAFRLYLNTEMRLKLKSCRNVIDGTFRAMMRDARKHGIGDKDHFADLDWPRMPLPKPAPFTAEERDVIVEHFRENQPRYHCFVATLFWTGMRTSEAVALRWSDVDLNRGIFAISRSRYFGADNPTKTAASEREISINGRVIALLRAHKPLDVKESDYVFQNIEGKPIKQDKWRKKYWYRALKACNIPPRKFYATRHTFMSVALSKGLNIKFLAEYCGTSVQMIEKHYGRYITNDATEQLKKLFDGEGETFSETLRSNTAEKRRQAAENTREKNWSGRVDLNHRLHGPEPCALPS
jgi:integrase